MTLDTYLSKFEFMTSDKPDLLAMNWFMEKLNNPHKKLKFIHVAGTNGKGSICEMLNKILILSNYTVGKYISPYLITANESICINNNFFSKDDEEVFIPKIDNLVKQYISTFDKNPSRFEVETSLALLYFYEKKCDIVILEVGLGGMYDCTNIIESSISVFGSISIDHTNILGNTIEKITHQKAGIIKQNCETVMFEQTTVTPIIEKVCNLKTNLLHVIKKSDISNININNQIIFENADNKNDNTSKVKSNIYGNKNILDTSKINFYQNFDYKNFKNIKLNLLGKKQIQNASVVLETIEILKKQNFEITENSIKNALCSIIHPARFEVLSNNPKIIFDGAHNENATDNFIETVKDFFESSYSMSFIVSIIKNKDYKTILDKLCTNFKNSKIILTDGTKEDKYLSKETLYEFAQKYSNYCDITTDDFENAIKNISSDVNFIVGSFYTYKLAKQVLK